jgi:sortase A
MAIDVRMNTRRVELILLFLGLLFSAIWLFARLHGALSSRAAIARFHAVEAEASGKSAVPSDPVLGTKVDVQLWSPKRVSAYEDSLTRKTDVPLAILRIPKINLEAPIFNDTDDVTLNRGLGRIPGTARVGEIGNLGVAGHRDGFFRGLKDIGPGDILELNLFGKTEKYVVSRIQIVKPEDTSVLRPTETQTLTLVTCFPFYYVGSAPDRYIVTASIQNSGQQD